MNARMHDHLCMPVTQVEHVIRCCIVRQYLKTVLAQKWKSKIQ